MWLYMQINYTTKLFTTSISSSVCRWKDVDKQSLHVELFPDIFSKGAEKSSISVGNNGHWEAIMFLHMFKEELSSMLCCRSLLAWYKDSHLGKSVDY